MLMLTGSELNNKHIIFSDVILIRIFLLFLLLEQNQKKLPMETTVQTSVSLPVALFRAS